MLNNNNNNNNNNNTTDPNTLFTDIARYRMGNELRIRGRSYSKRNNNNNNSNNNNNNTTNNRINNNDDHFDRVKDQLVSTISLDYVIPRIQKDKCAYWLSWSPDSAYLALATNDSVDIFDSSSGELLYCLKHHTQVISIVEWFHTPYYNNKDLPEHESLPSYTGRLPRKSRSSSSLTSPYNSFVTCSLDNTINVYRNFKLVQTLTHHQDWLKSLVLSHDDQLMLSGCASSNICAYDIHASKILFDLEKAHPHEGSELNTINTLKFKHSDSNVFFSGARYGTVRAWDIRQPLKPIFNIQAHNKLNSFHFTRDDLYLLTGGRDDCLRLWDLRNIFSDNEYKTLLSTESSQLSKRGIVQEYKGHKCSGYNIGSAFINNDRQIVSGSEDNYVYIYDTQSAKLLKRNLSHKYAVHLVSASPIKDDLRVATAAIDCTSIHVYSPQPKEEQEPTPSISSKFLGAQKPTDKEVSHRISVIDYVKRISLEKLMLKYGDELFKYYHKQVNPQQIDPEFEEIFKEIEQDYQLFTKESLMIVAEMLNIDVGDDPENLPPTTILRLLTEEVDLNQLENGRTNYSNNNNNNNTNNDDDDDDDDSDDIREEVD
ncbi:hypothetical protein DFA_03277 [Cavenderia fasciculata]|uniref:WD40 repeat-containing protein n=1 Tax=Cavenderia fasciculata TaxID=261658 RepID=F4PH47_CACFS|nr:uncharacterized protein DFA_03277 [Cavenderia fasciculata]EGG25031.1 hypothetical protein DFA_03277 [Cavenderia fasciculata]|eukprot:XP_004362882.1 hypothetical protein DFA_03277 [Cavenderia fasciculata]